MVRDCAAVARVDDQVNTTTKNGDMVVVARSLSRPSLRKMIWRARGPQLPSGAARSGDARRNGLGRRGQETRGATGRVMRGAALFPHPRPLSPRERGVGVCYRRWIIGSFGILCWAGIDRLADDHAYSRRLDEGISEIPRI